jgi:coenzyme F420-reducing hydrogenase beta subunit
MVADKEGFLYPSINREMCINCGLCEIVCPEINKRIVSCKDDICYAANAKNDYRRKISSSGGVFQYLAESILNMGGSVVAPVFDDKMILRHAFINSNAELNKAIGSKYVQSDTGVSYTEIKNRLNDGKIVYFAGTPCQVAGLKRFLSFDYEKLFTQDIICHGVPSPSIWKNYVNCLNRNNQIVERINFRDKERGWREYSLRVYLSGGKEYSIPSKFDPYLICFVNNLSLRPSCYVCPFKDGAIESDITLGDFWGIKKVYPDLDDNKGTSLVIAHSNKGMNLLANVKDEMNYIKVNKEMALRHNTSALKASAVPNNRSSFFHDLESYSFKKVMKKYSGDSFIKRLKMTVKSIVGYK